MRAAGGMKEKFASGGDGRSGSLCYQFTWDDSRPMKWGREGESILCQMIETKSYGGEGGILPSLRARTSKLALDNSSMIS